MSSSSLCRFVGGFGRKPFLLTTASSLLFSLSNQRRPECFSLFFSILICTPTPFSRPRLSLVYPTPTSKCSSLSILWHYITRVYATVSLGFLISSFFILNLFHSNHFSLAFFSLIFVRIIISVGFPSDRLSCGCRCDSTMTQASQPWPDNQLTPEAKL